ncbi:MAG: ATP-binding protein [Desulfomonilaceae bacterium]
MKVTRKIIEIDESLCNGCGNCIVSCAEGALALVDGKARLVSESYCDGLGACLGECPTGALRIVERTADDFDEAAVEAHLATHGHAQQSEDVLPCGCPSTRLQSFTAADACAQANEPKAYSAAKSRLSHWPVQIRLVPATAPFLKNADLLVAADCTAFAYPAFHQDFLTGKVALVGCPKFDDAQSYVEKFTEIFSKADIKSVTVLVMEVPCCHGLPMIVREAMKNAGKTIPLELVVIGVRGEILQREALVA